MTKHVGLFLFVLIMNAYCLTNDLNSLKSFLRARPAVVSEKDHHEFKLWPKYSYKQLYKNYVYRDMSTAAREIFFAVGIHPSCKAKKGQCIRRDKCVQKKMFYLSRVCYKHDLVCCYDDYPPINNDHFIIRPKEDQVVVTEKDKKDDKVKEGDNNNTTTKEGDKNNTTTKEGDKNNTIVQGDKNNTIVKDGNSTNTTQEGTNNNMTIRSGQIKLKHKRKWLRTDSEEDPLTETNSTITAVLLPKDNSTSEWSWWLVHDVTKQEILAKINPSIKIHEVNLSRVLTDFPEITVFLDNIPPQPNSTLAPNKNKIKSVTVGSITERNSVKNTNRTTE